MPVVSPEANALTRGTLGQLRDLMAGWLSGNTLEPAPTTEAKKAYDDWLAKERDRTQREATAQKLDAQAHAHKQAQAEQETKAILEGIRKPRTYDEWVGDEKTNHLIHRHQNETLCRAFERYMAAASKPNAFYKYINDHMREGFCPEEWSILTAGITFRGMPTSGDLMYKDLVFRNAGLHTHFARDNLIEEIGGGKASEPSHAKLLFDSLQMLRRHLPGKSGKPGDIPFIEDVCTHAIAEQLLRFRKEGIVFDMVPDAHPLTFTDWDQIGKAQQQRSMERRPIAEFNALCRARGIMLPHMVREKMAGWSVAAKELEGRIAKMEGVTTPYQPARAASHEKEHGLTGLWSDFIESRREEFRNGFYPGIEEFIHARRQEFRNGWGEGLKKFLTSQKEEFQSGWWSGEAEFVAAQRVVALLPDEKFLDYGSGTRRNQLADPDKPYDAQFALNQALDLLAREANSNGHVKAFLQLTQQHLGYIPNPKDRQTAMKWGDIHEGVQHGVEADHAAMAQELLLILAQATGPATYLGTSRRVDPTMLTNALNFVVDRGYFKLQNEHMQHVAEAMEAARKKAKDQGVPFIMPKPMEPEKSGFADAVRAPRGPMRGTQTGWHF